MIAQERIGRQVSPQPKSVTPSSIQTVQNNNWLHSGTDDAWLNYDYSEWLAPRYSEASTTTYKLPQYEEDVDCYDWTTPLKTSSEIWQEVAEFQASASSEDYDEF